MMDTSLETRGEWLKRHAVPINSLDPNDPLEDLEPLREIIGEARVVAIGENSHFIREFCQLRHRVLRFLVEHCGFTIYAHEFGFSEGFHVEKWLRGDGEDADLEDLMGTFPCPVEMRATLRWMREYNQSAANPIRFAGIDIPRAGGSLLPSLHPLADYLSEADPEALPWIESALTMAQRIDGSSMAASAPLLNKLSKAEQDALTANLSHLTHRMHALAPMHQELFGRKRFEVALKHLQSACYADYNLHSIAGSGLPGDIGGRECFMADSLLWHLENASPSDKIALTAHNMHIQKIPLVYDGINDIPMGQRISRALGDNYVSIGLTCASGNTASLYPDEMAPHGFRVKKVLLDPPVPGSIEAVLTETKAGLALINLHEVRGEPHVATRIRYDSDYLEIPVADAFDGLFQVPVSTVADDIGI